MKKSCRDSKRGERNRGEEERRRGEEKRSEEEIRGGEENLCMRHLKV